MPAPAPSPAREGQARRSLLRLWLGSFLLAVALFFVALRLMGPPPPDRLVLAAGPEDGVYRAHAERYAEILARDGIELEVQTTEGSLENLRLLGEGKADVAFVQGGTASAAERTALRSLASVFLEPLWIYHRAELNLPDLRALKGLRLAVGPEGSGTRALALRLLAACGALGAGVVEAPTLLALSGGDATRALLAGEVDAAFFVVAPEAEYLRELLGSPDVRVIGLRRHEAYTRRHRYLKWVHLPEGVIDLGANLPRRDLDLLAPTASLVAREDLHPAVIPLFVEAAREVHGGGSLLSPPGLFPSPHHVDVRLSEHARRYFDQGPSWLYRIFPFWLASFLDRAVFLLLPLVTLLFPLVKTAPPLYRWALRRRIYRWYRVAREADQLVREGTTTDRLRAEVAKLRAIEAEIVGVSIPLSYMEEFYNLRLHLEFVARRLEAAIDEPSPPAAGAEGEAS